MKNLQIRRGIIMRFETLWMGYWDFQTSFEVLTGGLSQMFVHSNRQ